MGKAGPDFDGERAMSGDNGKPGAFWPFVAGLCLGVIIGAMLLAGASNALDADQIKAGGFQHDGIAYRITPL